MWRICPRSQAWISAAAILAAVCALAGRAFAYQSETVAGGGTIAGAVRFAGPVPKPTRLEVSKDADVCGAHPLYDQSLVVARDGGIRYAVVTIADIQKGEASPPAAAVKFDQSGCEYRPHVAAFPAGSTIEILNSDGILHNIHTESSVNPVIDMAQPGFKKRITVTVAKPEVIKVTCDAHNWMVGWWYVTQNPYYAVTDGAGHFAIANVPPGTYAIQVWQEKLGTLNQKVTVKPSATTTADFTFKLAR